MNYSISIKLNGSPAYGAANYNTPDLENLFYIQTNRLELNITDNYEPYFTRFIDSEKGIRWLYGQPVKDTVAALKYALQELEAEAVKEDRDPDIYYHNNINSYRYVYDPDDYYCPCAINAANAIRSLIDIAEQCLEGTWAGN